MRRIAVLLGITALLSGCLTNTDKVKQLEFQWMGQQVTALANDNKTVQNELSDFGHTTKANWNISNFNSANDTVEELIATYMKDEVLSADELADIRAQDRDNLTTYLNAQQTVKDSRVNAAALAEQMKERADLLAAQLLDVAQFSDEEKAMQLKLWKSAAIQGSSLVGSLPNTTVKPVVEDTPVPEGTGNIPEPTTGN